MRPVSRQERLARAKSSTALAPKPPGFHTTAREPKHAHLRAPALQTPPKFNEKTPRETQKERNFRWERAKKERNFGGPAEGGPAESKPTTTRNNNNDNNNNNNHNIIRMNRDDETLVKSGKFKDCVLSWKFGKNVCKLSARIFGIGVFGFFSCVHVPGCAIGCYCGSSGDNDWKIRICVVFCLRQFVALWI